MYDGTLLLVASGDCTLGFSGSLGRTSRIGRTWRSSADIAENIKYLLLNLDVW